MNYKKQKQLEDKGWCVGNAEDLLGECKATDYIMLLSSLDDDLSHELHEIIASSWRDFFPEAMWHGILKYGGPKGIPSEREEQEYYKPYKKKSPKHTVEDKH